MKDYSNFINEKPFSCDVEGCSMRFVNEDHLAVHKKRHDMVLNLGLGPKGTTFADQTPTPTQFIRNCEEVGLFQDLQNVNPFEETFRKAAEAVKTGHMPCLDRTFHNSTDDTLHTPNIFPHITDVIIPSLSQDLTAECIQNSELRTVAGKSVNLESLLETRVSEVTSHIIEDSKEDQKEAEIVKVSKKRKSVEGKELKQSKKVSSCAVQLDSMIDTASKIVLVTDTMSDVGTQVKEKLRSTLRVKTIEEMDGRQEMVECVPSEGVTKVPIPKTLVYNRSSKTSIADKFAAFSKNSLKTFESCTEIFEECPTRKQKKRTGNMLLQESRSEYLARNRAAATRCREKKKMYISYLERLNRELTMTNHNLQAMNVSLVEQVTALHSELLRHQACSVFDGQSKTTLSSVASAGRNAARPRPAKVRREEPRGAARKVVQKVKSPETREVVSEGCEDGPEAAGLLDVVEVVLSEQEGKEEVVPLSDATKTTDIMVHFGNGREHTVNLGVGLYHNDMEGRIWTKIADEHCYLSKKHFKQEVSKKFLNYNNRQGVASPAEASQFSQVKTLTSDTVVLSTPSSPTSLILIKPFKKRNLSSKQSGSS